MCYGCNTGACSCGFEKQLNTAFTVGCGPPSPTPTVTPTFSVSPTRTISQSPTFTRTLTTTLTYSYTSTQTLTYSYTLTRTVTPTFSVSPTFTQTPWPAATTGEVKDLVVPSCGVPGSTITITFDVRAAAFQISYFKVAFSYDATPDASDNWVVANNQYYAGGGLAAPLNDCTTVASQQAQGGSGVPWYPQSFTLTVPPSTSGPFRVIVINNNGWYSGCMGNTQVASAPLSLSCGSPTNTPIVSNTASPTITRTWTVSPTPTFTRTLTYSYTVSPTISNSPTASPVLTATPSRTATPVYSPTISPTFSVTPPYTATQTPTPISIPMSKSSSVSSASLGDTLTYCITWVNNTGGATNVVVWDTVPLAMTYTGYSIDGVSGAAGGSYSPRLVIWDLGSKAASASGTVCFWGVISGYPWMPGVEYGQWLALYIREEDLLP
jgi:uncharacterized repeat protein (TIGR01451 family)